jgi:hypothetical protein
MPRKPKTPPPPARPATFDRAARDRLHPVPAWVVTHEHDDGDPGAQTRWARRAYARQAALREIRRQPEAATMHRNQIRAIAARSAVVPPSPGRMLIGDSRGEHVLVDPASLRVVEVSQPDAFGARVARGLHTVALRATRALRRRSTRARTAGAR